MKRTRRQITKIVAVFGSRRARWLLWRERWGDRSLISLEHRGRKHFLRLNSTDPLVWFSVFIQEDYGGNLPFEPRVIVDAGAYTGLSAIYFSNRYPEAEIIALEPDPKNYRLLLRNVGKYGRIHPVNAALWFEDTELPLYRRPEGAWASSTHAIGLGTDCSKDDRPIPAMRIETIMSRFAVPEIDVLKVDIEGAEKDVFEHSSVWINRVGAVFIETHDRLRAGCSEAVTAATPDFARMLTSPTTELLINPVRSATPAKMQ
jgi:FkbM family methyltransferase